MSYLGLMNLKDTFYTQYGLTPILTGTGITIYMIRF